ncbi:unnamed protein product, partial [Ectocarpus sp. 12 AP-2014]
SSGGGGLSEFWSCLDPKQRDSLLTINGKAVRDALDCDLCRDLVSSATFALEEETKVDMQPPPPPGTGPNGNSSALVKSSKKKPPKHSPKPTASGLRVIGDKAFMADWVGWPEMQLRWPCYVKYLAGVFALQPTEVLDRAVSAMSEIEEPWRPMPPEPGDRGCYCKGKLILKVVDMLTYPRPVRKFEVLVEDQMSLLGLREIMLVNVKLESATKLVLLTKGRAIGPEKNNHTLQELGFKNKQQVVVSQVLGGPSTDDSGTEEKNRQFVGDLLFGGSTPNEATAAAPKLNKATAGAAGGAGGGTGAASSAIANGSTVDGNAAPPPKGFSPGSTSHGGGTASRSAGRVAGPTDASKGAEGYLARDFASPPPPVHNSPGTDGGGAAEASRGRKRAADDRYDEVYDYEGASDFDGDGSGHDDDYDDEDDDEHGHGKEPPLMERVDSIMDTLEAVHAQETEAYAVRGPELLVLSVLKCGPDGETNGEPGTGRVPSLFANHGFQVLGQTLSRLARRNIAQAWKAELKAREYESSLLKELEAEQGGAGEEEGAAARRRSKKAKRKERDKKRREEEKRLQDEENAKRELARQEKIRLAEERVIEERRARLLQERQEQERQEAQWKLAQARRMQAEAEQLEAQLSLLGLQDETTGQPDHDEDTRQAIKNKSQPPSASVEQPASGGKGKKSKGKKEKQQKQKQQVVSTPKLSSKGIIGSRLIAAEAAGGGSGSTVNGNGSPPATQSDGSSSTMKHTYASAEITETISQFAGIGFAAKPPSSLATPVQQQQQQQQHRPPPGPIAPPQGRTASPSLLHHPSSPQAIVHSDQRQYVHHHHPAGFVHPQHHLQQQQQQQQQQQHAPTCAPITSLASLQQAARGPAMTVGVTSAVAPADTVMVNTVVPPGAGVGAGAAAAGGSVGAAAAAAAAAVAAAKFCTFCGERLVPATANFCAYCGQRVIRSAQATVGESVASPPLPPAPALVLPPPPHQEQHLLSHASIRPPPGPVGGGREQRAKPPLGPPMSASGRSPSSPYLGGPDLLPAGGGDGGSGGGSSSSLPFFQQFREANGDTGGGDSGLGVGGRSRSAGVIAGPGTGRPGLDGAGGGGGGGHHQQRRGKGETAAGVEGNEADEGASALELEGILGGGMGSLAGGGGGVSNGSANGDAM